MLAKKSELNIVSLLIFGCNFSAIPINSEIKMPIIDNIDLDIDFNILTNKSDKSRFKIILSITGNNAQVKLPGYFFSIMSEGVFKIDGIDSMKKEQIDGFLKLSALPILINHIRSYLINISSYYPYGKYVLPAVDLTDLLNSKSKLMLKKQSKK
jgi:preprotein translocase subunit SecB